MENLAWMIIVGVVGLGGGIFAYRQFLKMSGSVAEENAREIVKAAQLEGEAITNEASINSKGVLITLREEFEKSIAERRQEVQDLEKRLGEREINIERKMDLQQTRLDDLVAREDKQSAIEATMREKEGRLDDLIGKEMMQLEGISGMNRDEARIRLMQTLEKEMSNEKGILIRRNVDEIKQKCEREAQKLMVEAMQRFAGDCAYDRTTATIQLPSDEMKGRIIGREGRNIRVFESITGVNVLIDDTPSAVVITCFDPIRKEIARLSLLRLVEDGRIHPTRIEEVVEKTRQDIDVEILNAGEEAVFELQIGEVPEPVIRVIGRLKYRFSYTQNVLKHSIEVARFMAMIAAELGLDVDKAKRMGLMHDIGKALDHDVEGTHALIGMEFLKRHGIDPEVLNGVGCHHNEIPCESPLAGLVAVCDALSASRPGARSETTELYLKRLEKLEEIGLSFDGVGTCFAVQAGREVRVIVEPDEINENEATNLARELAMRIEEEVIYPGQIRICVIRETRTIEYAK